jgi:hypothetical protein
MYFLICANFAAKVGGAKMGISQKLAAQGKPRVHSFGHFEKPALLKAHTFSSLLKSPRFEKRELLNSAR